MSDQLPMAYGGCTCYCHRVPGVKHFVACCYPDLGVSLRDLTDAIIKYHQAEAACNECTSILRSDCTDPRPAILMKEMLDARNEMFKLVGL